MCRLCQLLGTPIDIGLNYNLIYMYNDSQGVAAIHFSLISSDACCDNAEKAQGTSNTAEAGFLKYDFFNGPVHIEDRTGMALSLPATLKTSMDLGFAIMNLFSYSMDMQAPVNRQTCTYIF